MTIDTTNRLKRKLAEGKLGVGFAVTHLRTVNVAMIAAACGFDALFIDIEHSPTSIETASSICVAAIGLGITPTVRTRSHDGSEAALALEMGAQGVVIPHVDTQAQARSVVEHCLYPPIGRRSAAGAGPAVGYRPMKQGEIYDYVNRETIIMVMIETPLGVENAEAIAAVPGIDVLHIGSNDLLGELGTPGRFDNPALRDAFRSVSAACRKHGKVLGIGGVRGDMALRTELVAIGARYMIGGGDLGYMADAARADMAGIRGIPL